jgi:hypothetical protein
MQPKRKRVGRKAMQGTRPIVATALCLLPSNSLGSAVLTLWFIPENMEQNE